MDEIDRARFDEFELAHPELSFAAHEALDEAPRLSPPARRFMAGEMDPAEARRLGYIRDSGDNA
ncbi:hypothetical protein [Kribbella shirazensis]|uniref:Uncharacterized protein n=1 Tax=Kribbella shirazensis TaxID=1105143 RepID=A0A7X5VBS1_9ACTN|nr:hypothetical protein [Kribbella shirazensis]NIK57901.1 hypothetical protein [Kribbella shirazensis]